MIYAGTASHVFSKREISAGLWTGGLSVLQRSCYLFFFFKKKYACELCCKYRGRLQCTGLNASQVLLEGFHMSVTTAVQA